MTPTPLNDVMLFFDTPLSHTMVSNLFQRRRRHHHHYSMQLNFEKMSYLVKEWVEEMDPNARYDGKWMT